MQTCTYCGRENPDDSALCGECETALSTTPEPEISPARLVCYQAWGRVGLAIGIVGLTLVLIPAVEFFFLPRGTPVRPMGWVVMLIVTAVFTLLIGAPCAIMGLRGGQKLICTLALVLAFAPWPAAKIVLHLASSLCGIVIEE